MVSFAVQKILVVEVKTKTNKWDSFEQYEKIEVIEILTEAVARREATTKTYCIAQGTLLNIM